MSRARVRLRYRPSADVLSGEVLRPRPVDGVVEQPDDDTFLGWSRVDGRDWLAAFHVLDARVRYGADGTLLHLPTGLASAAAGLLAQGVTALAIEPSVRARVNLVVEAIVEVDHSALRRRSLVHSHQ